jgi:hypothetical protein
MPLPLLKTGIRTRYAVLIAFVIGNLALVLAFPPCDYASLAHRGLPTFDGFYPIFSLPLNRQINFDFLMLVILVILINGCLGWLLIRHSEGPDAYGRFARLLIYLLGLNLLLILLFPPFADYRSISRSFIPSFEGFYFVFADNSQRRLVDEVLMIEIAMLLANAALIWLIIRESNYQERMLEQRRTKPL